MAVTFQGGQVMPAAGTAAYNSLASQSGAGSYNPSTGVVSVNGNPVYNPQTSVSPMSAGTFAQNPPALTIPNPPTYTNPGVINVAGLTNANMSAGADRQLTYTPPEVATADSEAKSRVSNWQTILGLVPKQENVLSSPEVQNQQAIVQQQRATLNDYTAQLNSVIAKQNQDLLSSRASVSAEGGTEAVYGGIAATINREAAIRALPLQAAVAAAQGNLQLAQEYLTQVTALKTEQATNEYTYRKDIATLAKEFATEEQKIRLDALNTKAAQAFDLQKLAIQNEYEVGLKRLTEQATGASAPKIVNVNGTDSIWDETKGYYVPAPVAGVGGGADQTQKSLDQLQFLRDTATKATEVSAGAGAGWITRTVGDTFVGDTRYRQLEAFTNTLKVNVLSLMTDPTIKKFFGPQMSNADVLLMTSAGTTLNPANNTPTQMRNEIKRLDDLFNRMSTAVKLGVSTSENLITAPNGEVIKLEN